MAYYFAKTLALPFDDAVAHVTAALKSEGFGILTEIDIKGTMKAKLDVDMPRYQILGACNPPLAHKALQAEPHIGLMLPCNVIVRETEGGTEVAAVDPIASMQAIDNPGLGTVASAVADKLAGVIEQL